MASLAATLRKAERETSRQIRAERAELRRKSMTEGTRIAEQVWETLRSVLPLMARHQKRFVLAYGPWLSIYHEDIIDYEGVSVVANFFHLTQEEQRNYLVGMHRAGKEIPCLLLRDEDEQRAFVRRFMQIGKEEKLPCRRLLCGNAERRSKTHIAIWGFELRW